jgi:hypothetical protein
VCSDVIISIASLVVSAGSAAVGVTSLLFARRAIRLAERQTVLAERAFQPHLWIEPVSRDEEEGTGNPMGAIQSGNAFGFLMIVGNDGGGAALGVRVYALIDGKRVAEAHGSPINLPVGEQTDRVALDIPGEYVVEVRGRGAPVFKGKLHVRAVGANTPHEAVWPDE